MKLASTIAHKSITTVSKPRFVHQIAVIGGWKHLSQPTLSSELECPICKERSHFTPMINPSLGNERVWMCGNTSCFIYKKENGPVATTIPPTPKRAVLWPLFCELNDIGNVYHKILFENIEQSTAMIDCLKKFASNPSGIILMQGDKGTGKTYSSLALCEFVTRRESSVIFMTQKEMIEKWLKYSIGENPNFTKRLKECSLLVIDDFGTNQPSDKFMGFFMDLINSRMQWDNRGTVITTNLDENKLGQFCGDALSDRLNTGTLLIFEGKTRRREIIR